MDGRLSEAILNLRRLNSHREPAIYNAEVLRQQAATKISKMCNGTLLQKRVCKQCVFQTHENDCANGSELRGMKFTAVITAPYAYSAYACRAPEPTFPVRKFSLCNFFAL